jgi:hypothetical protein
LYGKIAHKLTLACFIGKILHEFQLEVGKECHKNWGWQRAYAER